MDFLSRGFSLRGVTVMSGRDQVAPDGDGLVGPGEPPEKISRAWTSSALSFPPKSTCRSDFN